jgi:hypothetical protein
MYKEPTTNLRDLGHFFIYKNIEVVFKLQKKSVIFQILVVWVVNWVVSLTKMIVDYTSDNTAVQTAGLSPPILSIT